MEWIFFAVIAYLFFATANIIDGLAVKSYIKNPRTYLFYNVLFQGFVGIFIFIFFDVKFYSIGFILIAFLTGLFYVYGLIPYMQALKFEEVSRLTPLFGFGPLFVLIFSILILGLKLTSNQYIGFSLLIIGGILITVKKDHGSLKISKGLWYMVLTSLILTGFFIGTDYLFKNYDFWSVFAFIQLGILLSSSSLIIFKEYGQRGIKEFSNIPGFGKFLLVCVGIVSFASLGLRNVAIEKSSAALVTSLGGFSPLFVFIISALISIKNPILLNEDITKKVILQKIVAMVFLFLGIYFFSI